MLYVTYHKSQVQWGKYKDNVRFLPDPVGDMLLDFLGWVQPLRQLFLWEEQPGTLLSSFLWHKNGRVWDEQRLTFILRRACAAAKVPTFCISHWRQICASIIKVKFGADRECFKVSCGLTRPEIGDDDSDDDSDDDNSDDGECVDVRALIKLANHTVNTHNLSYSNQTGLVFANA